MQIVKYPHPALRHKSRPLALIDKEVRLMAGQMLELMYTAHGLGLAANQVNWPFQLMVMNDLADPEQKEHEHVLINPVIMEKKNGTIEGDEGCLSFPGLYQKVRRAKTVKIQAYNLKGELVERVATDLEARAWQHEIDHLNGVLFIDKMGVIARLSARSSVKSFESEFRRAQERGEIPPDLEIEKFLAALEAGG